MSLYYEAAGFLTTRDQHVRSLKSRVYNAKELKSTPAQVYALVSEASRWSPIMKEVVETSQVLSHERKLSPALALLLVHDLLLAKRGVAAPAAHPLRLAVERHKARLQAEFTKARLRRGLATVDAVRKHLDAEASLRPEKLAAFSVDDRPIGDGPKQWPHPRWVRINTLKTSLAEQLATTFAQYQIAASLSDMYTYSSAQDRILHLDEHIPDLLALPPIAEISNSSAYKEGLLILQDKASCFPAYLLNLSATDGDTVDACAAPGNKSTHLAALVHKNGSQAHLSRIWACERDKTRAAVLQKMVSLAGAQQLITVKSGQDFLRVDPGKEPWSNAEALLLDPSCSGSGIIGRDSALSVTLPSKEAISRQDHASKKRKRKPTRDLRPAEADALEESPLQQSQEPYVLKARLQSLAAFQTKLLLHAFHFPKARKVTYSTCSIYAEENETVVLAALTSEVAKDNGWRILKRDKQVDGMKRWNVRGHVDACGGDVNLAEACIRCNKGTREGTQGFFVAAFVKDTEAVATIDDGQWEGFSDSDL
ncbi:hypothetical protein MMC13_004156 [Lambiella insularis]|nr:hypothetical protein [Lambiella insularis]